MLRYIYADQLQTYPRLASTMFQDRARQFHDRLGWEVTLRPDGTERDDYDDRECVAEAVHDILLGCLGRAGREPRMAATR